MDTLEIIGVAFGLLYLYYEYKASVYVWIAGVIMPAIYIFVYYGSGFYADMGINIYYLIAAAYGWWRWIYGGRRNKSGVGGPKAELPITRTPVKKYPLLAAAAAVSMAVICYILINFTDSDVPYGDSLTTALSIVGMWMLAQKYVEQWLVWIAVDIVCCCLYFYKGLTPTALLYGFYTVITVFGYFKWLKLMKRQNDALPTDN